MRHGGMFVPSNDGRERLFSVEGLFAAEVDELLHQIHLGEGSPGTGGVVALVAECLAMHQGVFQPMVEAGEGYAVLQQGRLVAFDFYCVLDALHERDGVGALHGAIGAIGSLLIGKDGYAEAGKIGTHFVGEFLVVHIDCRTLAAQVEITDEDGRAGNVGATKVEDPGYLVEGREPKGFAALLLYGIEHTTDAIGSLLAAQFLGVDLDPVHRQ